MVDSPGVLEHQARAAFLAQHLPQGAAEFPYPLEPFAVAHLVLPVGQHAPVVEIPPIEAALGAQAHAVIDLVVAGDDRHGLRAGRLADLDGHGTQASGAAPDQDHVVVPDRVLAPAVQHAIGCCAHQHVGRGGLPGHVFGFGHALMRLHLRELGETPPVRFIAPDPEGWGIHGVIAGLDPGAVSAPGAAVYDHLVAHLYVGHVLADLVDDAGGVAAPDVEFFRLALLVARLDDIDGNTQGRPDVVVVDARGHDVDQNIVVGDVRNVDDLLLETNIRFTEPLRADQPGVHLRGNFAYRRYLTDVI